MVPIKHQTNKTVPHTHTIITVNVDGEGRFWLSTWCHKNGCEGKVLIEILPEQIDFWERQGIIKREGMGIAA